MQYTQHKKEINCRIDTYIRSLALNMNFLWGKKWGRMLMRAADAMVCAGEQEGGRGGILATIKFLNKRGEFIVGLHKVDL